MASQPVILMAGVPEDLVFVHISYVASHLAIALPNFRFQKIYKQRMEWEQWLKNFCNAHAWSHVNSPLIWREVGPHPGNAAYVGGATQFWEFIHEYYGTESRLSHDTLYALRQDIPQEIEAEMRTDRMLKTTQERLGVTILGGSRSLCHNLVAKLLLTEKLHSRNRIAFKLYDRLVDNTEPKEEMRDICVIAEGSYAITNSHATSTALVDCDLLIVLEEILRRDGESTDGWLSRNQSATLQLAMLIKDHAPPAGMKVIFCSNGPTCFNAGVLAAEDTQIESNNIVVVSAHQGFKILSDILNSAGVPSTKNIGCPPVWGFSGINHFVDVCNAVQCHDSCYRLITEDPRRRGRRRGRRGATSPLGERHTELRSLFYIAHDKNPQTTPASAETSDLGMCNAICDLLKFWYEDSCYSDGEIVPLGICSDATIVALEVPDSAGITVIVPGTFGIPKGMFFSQPVRLKERADGSRIWVPCSDFTVPNNPSWILNSMIENARDIVNRHFGFKMPL